MQITFDTVHDSAAHLAALGRFLQDLTALDPARPVVAEPAKPGPTPPKPSATAPSRGVGAFLTADPPTLIAPADRPDVGLPPIDDQQAAAVFGSQRLNAAPSASVPGVPTVPTAPAAAAFPASVTAPPVTAAGPSGGVDLDTQRLPWDPRIHGSTKSKNTDGTWRQRRGLNDPELRKRVEAELRATLALPAAPAVPTPPVTQARPGATTDEYLAGMNRTPAPPTDAMLPPAAGTGAPATFGEFMGAVSNLVKDGVVTAEVVTRKLQDLGLPSVMALANRPDLLPSVWQALRS